MISTNKTISISKLSWESEEFCRNMTLIKSILFMGLVAYLKKKNCRNLQLLIALLWTVIFLILR